MIVRVIVEVVLLAFVLVLVTLAVFEEAPIHDVLRRYIQARALEDTGSVNLVTSIYLGYRAFDTLGETIVLLLAVAGISVLREGKP